MHLKSEEDFNYTKTVADKDFLPYLRLVRRKNYKEYLYMMEEEVQDKRS